MAGTSACISVTFILIILAPFLLMAARQRMKTAESFIVREQYKVTPDGSLQTDHARFDVPSQTLILDKSQKARHIPFDALHGVYIQVMTSRKIHLGVIVRPDEWVEIGIVSNHDLRQAGINAHQIAEAVTQRGNHFLDTFREHQWPRALIGATFVYQFEETDQSGKIA